MNPKVSVIMPSLNVAPYIRKCLDSVVHQTLQEIEILCVDAGSTDGTAEILNEYAQKDTRVRVIASDRKSYGYQMNLGLAAAAGEYIGIVETDDFAEPEMFERLFACAEAERLDVVKSSYDLYWSAPAERNELYDATVPTATGRTFAPLFDLMPSEQETLFTKNHAIWSAIYRRAFLTENGIRFTETPGASYQDTAFALKTWCAAKRVRLLPEAYLHYRQDNSQSSIHSTDKVFCICDEYDEVQRWLQARPALCEAGMKAVVRAKFGGYTWNFHRLHGSDAAQAAFLQRFYADFAAHEAKGEIDRACFAADKQADLDLLLTSPNAFYKKLLCVYYRIPYRPRRGACKTEAVPNGCPVIGLSRWDKAVILLRGAVQYVRTHGVKRILNKMKAYE